MKLSNRLGYHYRIKNVNLFECFSVVLRCELLSMCKNWLSLLCHWRKWSWPIFSEHLTDFKGVKYNILVRIKNNVFIDLISFYCYIIYLVEPEFVLLFIKEYKGSASLFFLLMWKLIEAIAVLLSEAELCSLLLAYGLTLFYQPPQMTKLIYIYLWWLGIDLISL